MQDIVHYTKWATLNQWTKDDIAFIPRADPQIHNSDDCYACLNYIFGTDRTKVHHFSYKVTREEQVQRRNICHQYSKLLTNQLYQRMCRLNLSQLTVDSFS